MNIEKVQLKRALELFKAKGFTIKFSVDIRCSHVKHYAYDTGERCIERATIVIKSDESYIRQLTGLLHEAGHILDKSTLKYGADYGHINKYECEVRAWNVARALAKKYKFKIDEEYAKHCLSTYDKYRQAA